MILVLFEVNVDFWLLVGHGCCSIKKLPSQMYCSSYRVKKYKNIKIVLKILKIVLKITTFCYKLKFYQYIILYMF